MNKISTHFLAILAKCCLLGLIVYYIYKRIEPLSEEDYKGIFLTGMFQFPNLGYIISAVFLIPLNWYFESLKFHSLFGTQKHYNRAQCFRIILAGVSFALITPLKLGDYAGRLVQIDKKDWKSSLWATFLGNWCQWVALGVFGLAGFQIMLIYIKWVISDRILVVNILLLLVIIMLIYFLFKGQRWVGILIKFVPAKYADYFVKGDGVFQYINAKALFKACLFAGCRYWTYTFQFVFILKFLGCNLSILMCVSAVCTIYLIQLMLPFLNWLGLIGRTGIAIFVLGSVEVNEMISGIATLTLWMINMVIPALIGIYIIFKFRLLKRTQNEKEINLS